MIDFEKLGTIKLYEDDWSYRCGVDMIVGHGEVSVYEHNIEVKAPDCLRRKLKVHLQPLLETLHVTDELFIDEMRKRFGRCDGSIILRGFLDEKGINYSFQEFYNMFVFWDCLSICHHVRLNTSVEDFNNSILNRHGYSLCDRNEREMAYKGELPVLGLCSIYVYVPKELPIGHVRVVTDRKIGEEEMMPILEYMKQSMPCEPHYDDHGYRVMPKPHEIELVWEMPQGNVGLHWDGFNYERGNGLNLPRGDGYDFVTIDLWDCSSIQRYRDEEYWRSEVD